MARKYNEMSKTLSSEDNLPHDNTKETTPISSKFNVHDMKSCFML